MARLGTSWGREPITDQSCELYRAHRDPSANTLPSPITWIYDPVLPTCNHILIPIVKGKLKTSTKPAQHQVPCSRSVTLYYCIIILSKLFKTVIEWSDISMNALCNKICSRGMIGHCIWWYQYRPILHEQIHWFEDWKHGLKLSGLGLPEKYRIHILFSKFALWSSR